MKNNSHGALHPPLDCNPAKNLQEHLAFNAIVVAKLLEYLKLVKLVMI